MSDSAGNDALAFLKEELKTEDTEMRIHAMRRVSAVAVLLGAERTRSELLVILNSELLQ